jgi:hypothetical protein
MSGLTELWGSRAWTGHAERAPHGYLSLDDVMACGVPARFCDYGEALLFVNGEVYDVRRCEAGEWGGSLPEPLPRQVLESGVGIEYGWQHMGDCDCPHCSGEPAPADVTAAA